MSDQIVRLSDRRLTMSEVFGPTIQGEGPLTGRRATFVRLALCNLDCSNCDTAYTWDWDRFDRDTETYRATVPDVADDARARGAGLVVISGGEPLVQRNLLTDLIEDLALDHRVQVETNGTLPPIDTADCDWVVSPKMAAMPTTKRPPVDDAILHAFSELPRAALKVVCQYADDVEAAAELADRTHFGRHRLWIMPEGRTPAEVTTTQQRIAERTIDVGANLTTRLHIALWGTERGH